ncbi:MAG: hypothetical protein ABIV26_00080, partial [Candidatus Limnocylindrales bacterium]
AVDFLIRTHGEQAMVGLVRSYAGGVTDDEAFQAALGTDLAGFEAAWLADLGTPAPSPFGPIPAPSGPGATATTPVGLDVTSVLAIILVAGIAMAGAGVLIQRRSSRLPAAVVDLEPAEPAPTAAPGAPADQAEPPGAGETGPPP